MRTLKSLNQSDYKMLIVKDLGMKQFSSYRKRRIIFKCNKCKDNFETSLSSTTKKQNYCTKCNNPPVVQTHGKSNTKLYKVWTSMKQRCSNPKDKKFIDYGSRGIIVCELFKNSFEEYCNYVSSLKDSFKLNYSIDRINNDKNYEIGNLRWTDINTQNRNTKKLQKNNTSGYRGVTFNKEKNKWDAQITINSKHIFLGRFNCRLQSAYLYDECIRDNNLEHTTNFY